MGPMVAGPSRPVSGGESAARHSTYETQTSFLLRDLPVTAPVLVRVIRGAPIVASRKGREGPASLRIAADEAAGGGGAQCGASGNEKS